MLDVTLEWPNPYVELSIHLSTCPVEHVCGPIKIHTVPNLQYRVLCAFCQRLFHIWGRSNCNIRYYVWLKCPRSCIIAMYPWMVTCICLSSYGPYLTQKQNLTEELKVLVVSVLPVLINRIRSTRLTNNEKHMIRTILMPTVSAEYSSVEMLLFSSKHFHLTPQPRM